MMKDYDGKKVAMIYWPDGESMAGDDGVRDLTCCYEYHGECGGNIWIMETYEGEEIAIHNMKFIESVAWAV